MSKYFIDEKRLGTAFYNAIRNAMDKMGSQYVWTHRGHAYDAEQFKDELQFEDMDVLEVEEKATCIHVISVCTTFTVYNVNSVKHNQAVNFVKNLKEMKKRLASCK
mgnify:FL=1|tara:strand:- start:3173 stop:3490 length:318 start_codon:yes stop_codon:yes gene_type:complete